MLRCDFNYLIVIATKPRINFKKLPHDFLVLNIGLLLMKQYKDRE